MWATGIFACRGYKYIIYLLSPPDLPSSCLIFGGEGGGGSFHPTPPKDSQKCDSSYYFREALLGNVVFFSFAGACRIP